MLAGSQRNSKPRQVHPHLIPRDPTKGRRIRYPQATPPGRQAYSQVRRAETRDACVPVTAAKARNSMQTCMGEDATHTHNKKLLKPRAPHASPAAALTSAMAALGPHLEGLARSMWPQAAHLFGPAPTHTPPAKSTWGMCSQQIPPCKAYCSSVQHPEHQLNSTRRNRV